MSSEVSRPALALRSKSHWRREVTAGCAIVVIFRVDEATRWRRGWWAEGTAKIPGQTCEVLFELDHGGKSAGGVWLKLRQV